MVLEKRASNWLPALPFKHYGFTLTKSEFRDKLCIGYNTGAKNTSINCSCGETFTPSHALHCAKDGQTHKRQNENRDNFANIMHDVCYDVEFGPTPQLHQGESFRHKTTSTDENP